jgi:hypothetical protein
VAFVRNKAGLIDDEQMVSSNTYELSRFGVAIINPREHLQQLDFGDKPLFHRQNRLWSI